MSCHWHPWHSGYCIGTRKAGDLGSTPSECHIVLFVPLRPFFYAALAMRWKVQFRKGLRKFNNVDSKTTYFNENCCIM